MTSLSPTAQALAEHNAALLAAAIEFTAVIGVGPTREVTRHATQAEAEQTARRMTAADGRRKAMVYGVTAAGAAVYLSAPLPTREDYAFVEAMRAKLLAEAQA
jgi:hypothetical protein